MTQQRAVIRRPGRVIAQAKRTGAIAILEMIKRGENEKPGTYEAALKTWKWYRNESKKLRAAGDYNYFIPICNVEKYLRKKQHYMTFNTTALYGSTEAKRVYSWDEGSIGPMNQLLNLAGARLRFLAMTRYPFPTAVRVDYEYIKINGRVTKKVGWGYLGSRRSPKVILAHPTLQPLDFVDMIRAHVSELCRQCFILAVPMRQAEKYINLLIFRLRPFLDHIYTGQKMPGSRRRGTNGFIREANQILDDILIRLRADYGMRNGRPLRVTQKLSQEETKSGYNLSIDDLIPKDVNIPELKRIREKIAKGWIDDRDAQRLTKKILDSASVAGTRFHKRVSWGRARPFTNRTVVLGGDFVACDNSGYILAAEVPVRSRSGKADFVLYARLPDNPWLEEEEQPQGTYRPVMVLDLKTKLSYDYGIVGRKVKGTSKIVADEAECKRRPSELEWEEIIQNTPSRSESRQLDLYAAGLLEDYQRLTKDDSEESELIVRGILVCDCTETPSRIRRHLKSFAVSTYEKLREDLIRIQSDTDSEQNTIDHPRALFTLKSKSEDTPRMGIVLLPLEIRSGMNVTSSLPLPSELTYLHELDPFENRIEDQRHFTLYVSTRGAGAAESGSWLARYWHGIEYAREMSLKQESKSILWIDLAGEFSNQALRKAFVRTQANESTTSRNARRHVRDFLSQVKFLNLAGLIHDAIFKGGDFPSLDYLSDEAEEYDLVLVSGMDTLWSMTPSNLQGLLQTLRVYLAEATGTPDSTTIWFESTIPMSNTSELYKQHQVRPIPFDSPLQVYLDEIIMNLPLPPAPGISESSYGDHLRQIVKLTPDEVEDPVIVEVAVLRGWASRFRVDAKPGRRSRQTFHRISSATSHSLYSSDILSTFDYSQLLSIVPWVLSLKEDDFSNGSSEIMEPPLRTHVEKRTMEDKKRTPGYRGLFSRITFNDGLCDPAIRAVQSRKASIKYHPLSQISARRKNWNARLHSTPYKTIPIPPHESELSIETLLLEGAAKTEIDRMIRAVAVLRLIPQSWGLKSYLQSLMRVFEIETRSGESDKTLASKLGSIHEQDGYSSELWEWLSYHRSNVKEWGLSRRVRLTLELLTAEDDKLLLQYGNHFLMILAAIHRMWKDVKERQFYLGEIIHLWDCVRPWILLQLGASQSKRLPSSEFNMSRVFTNLMDKVECMSKKPEMDKLPFDNVRYGIVCDSTEPDEKGYLCRWYVFERSPYSNDYVAGCVLTRGGAGASPIIIPLDELADAARWVRIEHEIRPLMIANLDGVPVAYGSAETCGYSEVDFRSVEWEPQGHIRYGTRSVDALACLQWIRIYRYADFAAPQGDDMPARSRDLAEYMMGYLEGVADHMEEFTRVTCEVSGTLEAGKIRLVDTDGDSLGNLGFVSADRAVRLLRTPYDVGVPLGMKKHLLTWNPLTDITYTSSTSALKSQVERHIKDTWSS